MSTEIIPKEIILREFQFTYSIKEDRLRMNVQGIDNEQAEVWLTRRLMVKLLPALHNLLGQYVDELEASLPNLIDETQIGHNHIEKRYEHKEITPPVLFPSGDWHSTLTTHVEARGDESGLLTLVLEDEDKNGFSLHLSPKLLLMLCDMIAHALDTSEWDIGVDKSDPHEDPLGLDEEFDEEIDEKMDAEDPSSDQSQTTADVVKLKPSHRVN